MEAEPHTRLRAARIAAGYESAAAFANAHDLTEATYRSHENGSRTLTIDAGKQYASLLENISWQKLLFDEELAVSSAVAMPDNMSQRHKRSSVSPRLCIDELDVRASAGHGALVDGEKLIARWEIPTELIRGFTSAPPDELKIIRVQGDSMEPTLLPGQRVMVDSADRTPSPPGIFVVWDGLGFVIKRVDLVPHSEPLRVRISSDNGRYEPYERTLNEAYIQGRVIGQWRWM
jgi:phage repressor protein C with HTH and peptisase S24 domain